MDEDVFNVSFSTTSDVRISELTFAAIKSLAGVNRFCCLANNNIGVMNSESAVVIVESKCRMTARLYTITIMSLKVVLCVALSSPNTDGNTLSCHHCRNANAIAIRPEVY